MTPEKPVPHLSEGEKETLSDAARKYSDFGIYSLSESSMQKCQAFIAGAQWQERQSTQMYTAEQWVKIEDVLSVIKYMCGYTDFPERQEGQGVYYWRTILREKFEEIGVSFRNEDFVKAMPSPPKQ